jgi:hypothetical protein
MERCKDNAKNHRCVFGLFSSSLSTQTQNFQKQTDFVFRWNISPEDDSSVLWKGCVCIFSDHEKMSKYTSVMLHMLHHCLRIIVNDIRTISFFLGSTQVLRKDLSFAKSLRYEYGIEYARIHLPQLA